MRQGGRMECIDSGIAGGQKADHGAVSRGRGAAVKGQRDPKMRPRIVAAPGGRGRPRQVAVDPRMAQWGQGRIIEPDRARQIAGSKRDV